MEKEFRKLIFLLLTVLLFMSCEQVQVSSMTLQANFNDDFFRAYSVTAQASNNDEMLSIIGKGGNSEKFELHTEWRGVSIFDVGENEVNYATFKTADGEFYTTRSPGSTGVINITLQDQGNRELAGEFDFTLISTTDTIHVTRGVFYVVSYEITD